MTEKNSKKKVLVIGLQGLGNLILSSPLLHSLHRGGVGEVSVLVYNQTAAALMACYPFLKETIVVGDHSRLGLLRLLRARCFDAVVVAYPGGPRTSFLAGLSGAALKIGHQGRQSWVARRFLDEALLVDDQAHDVDNNRALFRSLMGSWNLDPDPEDPNFTITLPALAEEEAAAWFTARDLDQRRGPVVGVAPGCGRNQVFKRWALENFIQLATGLEKKHPEARLVWFFGPDETELRDSLPENLATNVACGQSLPVILALLSRCGVLISNDSGQMHMANALGVPTVSIFGPTSEIRTRPWLASSKVMTRDIPCRPCYSSNVVGFECTHDEPFACLTAISVDEVLDTLLAVLSDSSGGSPS